MIKRGPVQHQIVTKHKKDITKTHTNTMNYKLLNQFSGNEVYTLC